MATNQEKLDTVSGWFTGNLEKLGKNLSWWIWHGNSLGGWNGQVSPGARIVGTDKAVNDSAKAAVRIEAKVDALAGAFAAVQQGETFDPAKYEASMARAVEAGLQRLVEAGSAEVDLKFKTEAPKEN